MARDGEWADHVVVVAMARKLQMDIMIVTSAPSASPEDIIVWVVGQTASQGNPILLGHIWESHYLSLQPIAPANLVPVLVSSSEPATTDIPTSAQKSGPTTDAKLGSMSSPAVSPSATRTFITQHVSAYGNKPSPTDAMQMPALGSTPSTNDVLVQTQSSGSKPSTSFESTPSTASGSTPSTTSGSTPSTTSGSTPSTASGSTPFTTTGSTTADVMQAATSNSTTIPVMQNPTYASTFHVMSAVSSVSTPSTTDGLMQVPTSVSAPTQTYSSTITDVMSTAISRSTISSIMQTPNPGSTTANFMQVLTVASTPSSTTISTPSTTFSSTIASGVQTVTSSSTTTDSMQAPASGSKPSTTADIIPAPISSSTAADIFQAQTSNSEPPTTAGLMQASTSSSTSADVTQSPAVEDTDRFMHIACLLVNVGSRVLRRLLLYHTVTPTCTLDQCLAKERIDIDGLRKRKILNKSQMDIMFPKGGSTNLGDYDITLLSALFTNIVLTISPQELNMIQFLREKRNEIFAHAKSVAVNSNDYQTFWNDICRTLEALSKHCNDPDFENEILREIQGIQVSTVQGTSFLDTLQTCPRRIETLERLFQAFILSQTKESDKSFDDSDL